MLVMVVFFIAFRWIHLSTPLIRLFLLVLILLLMPTLNFLPVWFALSLLRFRLPSRLPMMFILWIAQTAGQYFTNDQIKEMTRKVSAEVDLVHQQTQNQRYGSSHIGATAKDISNVVTDAASGVVDI